MECGNPSTRAGCPPKDCGRDIWLNVAVRTGGLDGAATCSYGNLTEGIADDFARGMIEAAVHLLIDQLLKLARERDIHRPSVGAISTSVKFSYCWRRALPASTPSAYRALDHGDCHHLTCFGRLCRPCCLFQCPGVWRLPPLFTISPNGAAIIGAWGDSPWRFAAYRASAITCNSIRRRCVGLQQPCFRVQPGRPHHSGGRIAILRMISSMRRSTETCIEKKRHGRSQIEPGKFVMLRVQEVIQLLGHDRARDGQCQ